MNVQPGKYCISTIFERAKLSCLCFEGNWYENEVCALIHDENYENLVGFWAPCLFS